MKIKTLILSILVLTTLIIMSGSAFAGSLSDLTDSAFINPEGVGDVLIFPYWESQQNDEAYSVITIINTDLEYGVIAKLIFETKSCPSSEETNAIFIYLSAADMIKLSINEVGGQYRVFNAENGDLYCVQNYEYNSDSLLITDAPDLPLPSFTNNIGSLTVIGVEKAVSNIIGPDFYERLIEDLDAPNKLKGKLDLIYTGYLQDESESYEAETIANFYINGTLFETDIDGKIACSTIPPTNCEPFLFGNTNHQTNDDQTEFALSKSGIYLNYNEGHGLPYSSKHYSFLPLTDLITGYTMPYDYFDSNENMQSNNMQLCDSPDIKELLYDYPPLLNFGWINFDSSNNGLYSSTGNYDFFGHQYSSYNGIPFSGVSSEVISDMPANPIGISKRISSDVYEKNWDEDSLYLNPGKTGDALICAYWAASDFPGEEQETHITITNTAPDKGILYKLRFREFEFSEVVYERDLWLSANDTHNILLNINGEVQYDIDDKVVGTCDSTFCTFTPLSQANIIMTRGYFEIIAVEATAPEDNGDNTFNRTSEDAPNSLFAEVYINGDSNTNPSEEFVGRVSYQCDAISNFYKSGSLFEEVSNFPDSPEEYGPYLDDAEEGLDKLEMVLSKKELIFPYLLSQDKKTFVIYTLPTKHFHYDMNNMPADIIESPSNPFIQQKYDASQDFQIIAYDASENTLPVLPSGFEYETNLFFADGNFQFDEGWAKIIFDNNHIAVPSSGNNWDYYGSIYIQNYTGLPVIGLISTFKQIGQDYTQDTIPLNYQMELSGFTAICGNGIAEGEEECDDLDFKGLLCNDFGYLGGNLICNQNCEIETTNCDFFTNFCITPQALYTGKYFGDLGHRDSWTGDWTIGVWTQQGYLTQCEAQYPGATFNIGEEICTNDCEVYGSDLDLYIDLHFDDSSYANEFGQTLFTWGPFEFDGATP